MIRAILLSGGTAWVFVKAVTVLFGLIAVSRLLPGPNRQVPGYRARPLRATVRYGGAVMAAAALIAGCTAALSAARRPEHPSADGHPTIARSHPVIAVGMFAPGVTTSYTPERQFTTATGAQISYVLSYSAFPAAPFNGRFAQLVSSHGATPVIQLMPSGVTMRQVAVGDFDAPLRAYAAEARAFGRPVILSFAPEANGNWYRWGYGRTLPSAWVAAWRHVVTVFQSQHASNVTWMWTMNIPFPHSGPVSDYWPGAAYVGLIGIDGYYVHPSDTFTSVFGPVISQVRGLTSKPVLISETAAGPDSGPERETQIQGLFAGAVADHLVGVVWFDEAQDDGIYHQDWRIENDPAALAAFRAAVREYDG